MQIINAKFAATLALLSGLAAFNVNAQVTTSPCPTDATDTGVAVLLSAFRINANGTTGPAIGSGSIGICECIRLRVQITYVTPGPSGGKVAFFSGGTMTVQTLSGSFTDDVTPAGGVPLIGNPADPNAASCGTAAVPNFLSDFSQDYCVKPTDIVNGNITFLASYVGAFEYFGAGIPNQPTGTTAIL